MVLLHSSINAQLDSDPSAHAVRARVQPLLQEAASRLLRSDLGDQAKISCPLALRAGAPLLRLQRPLFAALQALVNSQLAGSFGGSRAVHGVVAAWGQHLLWSTLAPADANALFALASRGPLAAVRAGARHRTVKRPIGAVSSPGGGAATAAAAAGTSSSSSIGGSAGGSSSAAAGAPHHLLNAAYWEVLPSGVVQPIISADGAAAAATALVLPPLFIQGGQERCRLLVHRSGPLVFLLILTDAAPAALAAAAAAVLAQVSDRAPALAVRLAAELPSKYIWHVPGLRYHYADAQGGVERCVFGLWGGAFGFFALFSPCSLPLLQICCHASHSTASLTTNLNQTPGPPLTPRSARSPFSP